MFVFVGPLFFFLGGGFGLFGIILSVCYHITSFLLGVIELVIISTD